MTIKSIIITHTGYQDQEVIYPYHRLVEESAPDLLPVVFAENVGPVRGILGTEIEATQNLRALDTFSMSDWMQFDLLVLPGGVKALEKLRLNVGLITFIAGWNHAKKVIAVTCSGVQLLISARAVKGHSIACYPAFAIDVENAGGRYLDEPVAVSGHIVSSPHYRHLSPWMAAAIAQVKARQGAKQ